MSEVTYAVVDVSPQPYSVTPVLTARVGVASVGDDPVHAIALRCQVRIDPLRRRYSDEEAAGLLDLFGPRERWSTTQRTFVWLHCAVMVPGFSGATQVELPLGLLLLSTFKDTAEKLPLEPGPLTLSNYIEAFSDPDTYILFQNSVLFAAATLLIGRCWTGPHSICGLRSPSRSACARSHPSAGMRLPATRRCASMA